MSHKILRTAEELPPEWDALAPENPYLARSFLSFVEGTEKDFHPTYHLFYDGERLDSVFVAFPLKKYNVAMFTKWTFKINVTMIYLPMSVTRGGFHFGKLKKEALAAVRAIKGYKMLLNAEDADAEGFAVGLTCPKCILTLRWDSFDAYLGALRSDYRNRAKKVFKRSSPLTMRFIRPEEFTDELYQTYLNVLHKSKMRLETLSKEYFQGPQFKLFVMEKEGKPVGFIQLLPNGDELVFEFVGIDYEYNQEYAVYHRMLFEIIRYGIEKGYKTIDFGQTADDVKRKLGSEYVYLYAYFHHSNPVVNFFCKKLGPFLEYKPLATRFNCFKETEKEAKA